jgi:hypothetical protein
VKTEKAPATPWARWRWSGSATAVRLSAWFLAIAVVALVLLTAAFQYRPTYVLDVGDTPHDTGLVHDFN